MSDIETVVLKRNQTYNLQVSVKTVKLVAPTQSINLIIAPRGYTIAGLTSFSISNQQFMSIQLDPNTKTWNVIDGLQPHNNVPGLQGGGPGEYYHLKKAQWLALTQTGLETVLPSFILNKGDNIVPHNLGLKPRIITFWDVVEGIQVTFAPNINVDPDNNFFLVNTSKARTVDIYVRAYGKN